MNEALRRRLSRLEDGIYVGDPTRILADRPIEEDEAFALLADWRRLVAAGEATVVHGVLSIVRKTPMTERGWITEFVSPH